MQYLNALARRRQEQFVTSPVFRSATTVPVVLSAYNAASVGLADRPQDEALWYSALRDNPAVDGLEIASVRGTVHPRGPEHLTSLLHPEWGNVISTMGGALLRLHSDRDYGLASRSEAGRASALADLQTTRLEIARMRELIGTHTVRAVVLNSAPRADRGSKDVLRESLLRIVSEDWGPTTFLLEHADALVAGQQPQKGWQTLATEIEVVKAVRAQTDADVRLLLNWGRVAIEARSAEGAQHLMEQAVESGLVGAVTLSGATGHTHSRGHSWADVHLGLDVDEPASLLTQEKVRETLRTAPDDIVFVGVKTGAPAGAGSSPLERLRLATSLIDCVTGQIGSGRLGRSRNPVSTEEVSQ